MNNTNILLRNNYVQIPCSDISESNPEYLATILMNLEYYSYCLSPEAFKATSVLPHSILIEWWFGLEKELRLVSGDSRNIGKFVVYKNFPAEVLSKNEAEYWIPQILMYWGFPKSLFTEPASHREDMNPSDRKSVVLMPANSSTLQKVLNSLLSLKVKWKHSEFEDVLYLCQSQVVDFSKVVFKENLVELAKHFISAGIKIKVKTATDVLRLAAGLSDGDVSLREKVKFKSFSKKTRRFFMSMLGDCNNLVEDVARRKNVWKKFFHNIHPGDFKTSYASVVKVADSLYNDNLTTFNSRVEDLLKQKDASALDVLSTRPGEFMRRLVHTIDLFGNKAVFSFTEVLPKLTVQQLVSIRRLLENANVREHRVFPPKGNWAKLKIGSPRTVNQDCVDKIVYSIGAELAKRVPAILKLDPETELVKLPNGNDEGSYSRGTVFKIPDGTKFIRTASYWENKSSCNTWFDNGWNFFDDNWKSLGVCCWSNIKFVDAAVFSGDPCNSSEMKGRAAQLIDIYPDKLVKQGIRYAVWNILCYSEIPFSNAKDVFAALQWGSEPQDGKLFEPSRCQLSFKLTGEYKTKYVCVIDLQSREMIYIDANLKSSVRTAAANGATLSEQMPAFMEYVKTLPSIHDLFKESVRSRGKGHVLYSNKGIKVGTKHPSYVFKNDEKVDYQPIDLNKILNS
jgi:hypothetical protein